MTKTISAKELRDRLLRKLEEVPHLTTEQILTGTKEVPIGTPHWCALAIDKIEGLQEDLKAAVEVAYKRGATVWTELNYPEIYKRLRAAELAAWTREPAARDVE